MVLGALVVEVTVTSSVVIVGVDRSELSVDSVPAGRRNSTSIGVLSSSLSVVVDAGKDSSSSSSGITVLVELMLIIPSGRFCRKRAVVVLDGVVVVLLSASSVVDSITVLESTVHPHIFRSKLQSSGLTLASAGIAEW